MQEQDTWILEIACEDRLLKMSLYESQHTYPLKAINAHPVDFSKIEHLNNEIIALINKANRKGLLDEDSITEFKKNTHLLYDLLLSRQVKNRLSSLGSVNPALLADLNLQASYSCQKGGVNLILSLDEKLIGIPWELLFDGKDFLCLKFNLGRSIHTQNQDVQPRYRSIPARPRMLILANPTGDLKSAYQEGLYIKACLNKKGILGVDFKAQDIDSNYVHKNLRDYDIIHFAGHCEYNSKNPEESGWVLSDGWVSARDFLSLGESAGLPSIIFVNACQSARTANNLLDLQAQNNIYGLASAFLFAGVRHYLGSFWRVEDKKSGEFAEEFYSQVANAQSIGKAVRSARLRLFHQYGISAIAWAGYVLYGDPSFILLPPKLKTSKRAVAEKLKVRLPAIPKKRMVVVSLGLATIILGLTLSKVLPTLNPSTYLLFSQAKQLYRQGNNPKVIELLNQIIKQDPLYLPALRLQGEVYFHLGKFSDALSGYFDYARFSERKKDHKHLASAYIKIAWIYHMWGDYQKAFEFYQKALNLSRKYQDKLNEADAMARLAVWHTDKGDRESAFSLLMKSSEINREMSRNPEHRFNLACDYFNIAYLYVEKEDYPTAKELFNKSKEIFSSLKAIPELSDYYFDMGEVALFEKDYDLALQFYQKGLALDRQLDNRFNLCSDYWMLGEFYSETGKFTEAKEYFKEAIFICQEIDNRPVLAGVNYDLGLMYKDMGEIHKAKDYFSEALKLYKTIDTPDYQKVQQAYLALE